MNNELSFIPFPLYILCSHIIHDSMMRPVILRFHRHLSSNGNCHTKYNQCFEPRCFQAQGPVCCKPSFRISSFPGGITEGPPRTKAQFRAGSPLTANRFVLFPPSPVPASFFQSRPQGLFFLYYAPSNPHRNYCMCFKARWRSSRLDNNTQVLPTTEFLLTSSSFVGRSCVLRFEGQ